MKLFFSTVVLILILLAVGYFVEWSVLNQCLYQGYFYNRFTGMVSCHLL